MLALLLNTNTALGGHFQICSLGCKTGVFLCLSVIAASDLFNQPLDNSGHDSVFASDNIQI